MFFKVFSIVIILFALVARKNTKTPRFLGHRNGQLYKVPKSPNAVSSQTKVENKKVEALNFIGTLKESKKKIKEIIKNYDAKIIKEEDNYLHIVFTTGLMKYKDDVEFYFNEKDKKIDYRSESRLGYSDMGLNRKRYQEIKNKYEN